MPEEDPGYDAAFQANRERAMQIVLDFVQGDNRPWTLAAPCGAKHALVGSADNAGDGVLCL
jgi:hypothetical protein